MKNRIQFKIAILGFLTLLLSSCYPAKYTFSPESSNYGIVFGHGKWLLNEIESSYVKEELTEMAISNFKYYLKDDLDYVGKSSSLLGSKNIPLNPDKERLKILKSTGYDFIINIKVKQVKEDMQGFQIVSSSNPGSNIARVTLEIYDLNNLEIIYLQQVNGSVSPDKIKQDFSFVTTTDQIIKKSMKKIFRKIKRNHVKKN